MTRSVYWNWSTPPLGFQQNGSKRHRMIPVPDELETVRCILAWWRQGRSFRQIAAQLNEKGHRTKQGGRWHPQTIKKVVDRRAWYARVLSAS